MREARRAQIVDAFARVLADRGYASATIAAIAEEASCAPGLIHHHFDDKDELLGALLDELVRRFRRRLDHASGDRPLADYGAAALALDDTADVVAARCWVGLFAEASRNRALFDRIRRLLDTEIAAIERRSGYRLSSADAATLLSFVVGALVVGAFAPRKTAGFAAEGFSRIADALSSNGS